MAFLLNVFCFFFIKLKRLKRLFTLLNAKATDYGS